jgi:hypothetical protein
MELRTAANVCPDVGAGKLGLEFFDSNATNVFRHCKFLGSLRSKGID